MAKCELYESIDISPIFNLDSSVITDAMLEMIDDSMPILLKSVKDTLKGVIKEQDSGAIKNFKSSKATKCKNGAYIATAYTKGKTKHFYYNNGRKVPVYHDDALKWLEYGREGQPPRPWVGKATRNAEKAVLDNMQSVYNKKFNI